MSIRLAHNNNRKTTRARLTQVITVPKYIVNPAIKDEDKIKLVRVTLRFAVSLCDSRAINKMLKSGAIVPNKNKWAGKRKFIYHKPTMK